MKFLDLISSKTSLNKIKSIVKTEFAQKLFFVGVLSMATNVINYLFNLLIAQRLPDQDFALVSVIIAILYLILLPASTVEAALTKFVAQARVNNQFVNMIKLSWKFAGGAVIIAALLLIASPIIASVADIDIKYALLIAMLSLPMTYSTLYRGILMGTQYINTNYFIVCIEAVLKIGLLFLFLSIEPNVYAGIISWGLPTILSLAVGQILIIKLQGEQKSIAGVKEVVFSLKASLPVIVTFLFYYCGITLDLVFVSSEIRPQYAALLLLGKIIYFAAVIFAPVMFAMSAAEVDQKKRDRYFISVVAVAILVIGFVLTFYYLFGQYAVETIFAGKYAEINDYLVKYSFGMGLYALSFIGLNYLIINEDRLVVWISLVLPFVQIMLFAIDNSSLGAVVNNQLIAFSVLFVAVWVGVFHSRANSGVGHRSR